MQILTKNTEIAELCKKWSEQGERIALVPTMGYYHAGHESLMKYAKENASKVVVSLFVNPKQFGPNEDLESYPRNLERDAQIAKNIGVDALFAPSNEDMYSVDFGTVVSMPRLSVGLCGKSRPTHFDGVCTVVLKLLLLVKAQIAVFGQKDWQQLAIICQMVRDLHVPTEIVGRPIVREADGLALSSRNVNLTQEERTQASQIYQGLCSVKNTAQLGQEVSEVLQEIKAYWAKHLPLGALDYAEIVDANSLEPQIKLTNTSLLACAIKMSKARLIDNMLLF